MEISQALKQTAEEFSNSQQVIRDAGEYASQFRDPLRRQGVLAYMFTAGRAVVDRQVRNIVAELGRDT